MQMALSVCLFVRQSWICLLDFGFPFARGMVTKSKNLCKLDLTYDMGNQNQTDTMNLKQLHNVSFGSIPKLD